MSERRRATILCSPAREDCLGTQLGEKLQDRVFPRDFRILVFLERNHVRLQQFSAPAIDEERLGERIVVVHRGKLAGSSGKRRQNVRRTGLHRAARVFGKRKFFTCRDYFAILHKHQVAEARNELQVQFEFVANSEARTRRKAQTEQPIVTPRAHLFEDHSLQRSREDADETGLNPHSQFSLFECHERRRRKEIDRKKRARALQTKDDRGTAVREQPGVDRPSPAQALLELASQPANKEPIGQHQNILMVRNPIALTLALLALLVACGRGGSPASPKGWQPIPGASAAWSSGSGSTVQRYFYTKRKFGGTLQDLASQVTIEALMHHRGAKFHGSVPFAPCPGSAGVAAFTLPDGKTLQEGFTVGNGQSIRTTYVRPSGTPSDPNVTEAMQSALCITPA